jgi:hypothetical protein
MFYLASPVLYGYRYKKSKNKTKAIYRCVIFFNKLFYFLENTLKVAVTPVTQSVSITLEML